MKTPEEINKGLECCTRSLESSVACRECPYQIGCFVNMPRKALLKDVHSLIQQLWAREWDLFDLISSAWFGKRCYFRQDNGNVYSRSSGEYMSFDQAIDELAHELTCERECEQTGKDMNVPRWISVEERLPKPETQVLILAKRRNFTIITNGMYEDGTLNTEDSDWHWYDNDFEYDEENDAYIIPEGWWEYKHYNGDDEYNHAIDDKVTHWMPLPPSPEEVK